ncbi:MAG: hypothetical protein ACF8PN_12285 [Phycisphaerales bacterium]
MIRTTAVRLALILITLTSAATTAGQDCFPAHKLRPRDGTGTQGFGTAVALTQDGTLAVGAPSDATKGYGSGAVYLYNAATGAEMFKIYPSQPLRGSYFGQSIAIDGSQLAVAAPQYDHVAPQAGAVFVFDVNSGAELFAFKPGDLEYLDRFGSALDMANDRLIASSTGDTDPGTAYLYDLTSGDLIHTLLPDASRAGSMFAQSVAINDTGIVAVGDSTDRLSDPTPGAVHLYDGSTGELMQRILSPLPEGDGGFGSTLAMNDTYLVVGAPWSNMYSIQAGAVFVYSISDGSLQFELIPDSREAYKRFGWDLEIVDDVVYVAAPGNTSIDERAYAFDLKTANRLRRFQPASANMYGDLAYDLAAAGDQLVLGAERESGYSGVAAGSAYIYDLTDCARRLILDLADVRCPARGPIQFKVHGGGVGEVALVYSTGGSGSFTIPNGQTCAGVRLDLAAPVRLLTVTSGDPAIIDIPSLHPGVCGHVIVQAIDTDNCLTSNVIVVE